MYKTNIIPAEVNRRLQLDHSTEVSIYGKYHRVGLSMFDKDSPQAVITTDSGPLLVRFDPARFCFVIDNCSEFAVEFE